MTVAASFVNERTPLVDQSKASVVVKVLVGISIATLFISVSASMILFNKALMREDRFPFPVFLTTLHMAGSLTLSLLLRSIAPSFFPSASSVFRGSELPGASTEKKSLRPFVPIALCGALCLVAGNWAYKVATVSFLQMVKESHIIIVYTLMVLFGLDTLRFKSTLTLIFVAICSMVAVSAQVSLSIPGLVLQTVCGVFGSLQLVLTNMMMARSGKGKIDPMTMVLCTAPVMLAFLLPANVLFWDPLIPERLHLLWRYIACNMVLAFTLQVTIAVTVRSLSATGFSLASILKDLGIVFAASCVLGEHLTSLQLGGFLGSIVGIGLYSAMKIFPEAFDFSSSTQGSGRK
mmetsp:Transcript_94766/g.187752  ORF Transcript_94766/g.187752 Transcript_94766/m.187752 type:complete len:348 (-) Transcript_94766:46-1089(-)